MQFECMSLQQPAKCTLELFRAKQLLICLLTFVLPPVQGRIRTLLAEVSAGENTIADLQGRLMDPSTADAPFVPATPEDPAQSPSTLEAMPSAPATADDIPPATSTHESNPSVPATAEEGTTSAASEAPRDSTASLGRPRGPALLSLPEGMPPDALTLALSRAL